jgi:hypothetical protein
VVNLFTLSACNLYLHKIISVLEAKETLLKGFKLLLLQGSICYCLETKKKTEIIDIEICFIFFFLTIHAFIFYVYIIFIAGH